MGIQAELKQVSAYLLEKLKKHPEFADVFFYAELLPESEHWQKYPVDSTNLSEVEDYEDFINWVPETLQKLKAEKPEEFEQMKADIPQMIAEGIILPLDLDKTWRQIHFILTGYDDSVRPTFLIGKNDEDCLPAINAVLGGSEIEYYTGYGLLRYLTTDEVKRVAEALSRFSQAMIQERLKFRGLPEDMFDYLFDYTYNPMVQYYQGAAEKGNAMFLYLC
ncbi:MAG TPA: hypothetical protein DCY88_24675 [Cyanobacteria bacterium UBA11372]|nr:hypothetical protein [Cyanobacteria bacterium UBA11372]